MSTQIDSKVETITPEIAKAYLKKNQNNYRSYRARVVQMYADDMKAGRWRLNGESIKFSKNGNLIDGQHRLMAIIKAGVPVDTLVVRDVSDEIALFDSGYLRSASQIAKAAGLSAESASNAALGAVTILLCGTFDVRKTSKEKVIEYVYKHSEMIETASRICRKSDKPIARKSSIILACYTLLRYGFPEKVLSDFFEIVNTGFPKHFRVCSSAIVLRNWLLANKKNVSAAESRQIQFSATISAAYDFLNNVPRTRMYKVSNDNLDLLIALRNKDLIELID